MSSPAIEVQRQANLEAIKERRERVEADRQRALREARERSTPDAVIMRWLSGLSELLDETETVLKDPRCTPSERQALYKAICRTEERVVNVLLRLSAELTFPRRHQ